MNPLEFYNGKPVLRISRNDILEVYNNDPTMCYDTLDFIQDMYCTTFCFSYEFTEDDFIRLIEMLIKASPSRKCYIELRVMDLSCERYYEVGLGIFIFSGRKKGYLVVGLDL
jgi:hypothetical protein